MNSLILIIAQAITVQRTAGGTGWSSRFLFCSLENGFFLQLSTGSLIPRFVGRFQMYNHLQSGHPPVSITIWQNGTLLIEVPQRTATGEMRGRFSKTLKTCIYRMGLESQEKEALQDNQVICPIPLQQCKFNTCVHSAGVHLCCFYHIWLGKVSDMKYVSQPDMHQFFFVCLHSFICSILCCVVTLFIMSRTISLWNFYQLKIESPNFISSNLKKSKLLRVLTFTFSLT